MQSVTCWLGETGFYTEPMNKPHERKKEWEKKQCWSRMIEHSMAHQLALAYGTLYSVWQDFFVKVYFFLVNKRSFLISIDMGWFLAIVSRDQL